MKYGGLFMKKLLLKGPQNPPAPTPPNPTPAPGQPEPPTPQY
jgi:hypothetical protein